MHPPVDASSRSTATVAAFRTRLEDLDPLHKPEMIFPHPIGCGTAHFGVIRITEETAAGMWERHDDGDELLMVFHGRMRMTVSGHGGDTVLNAGPGDVVFIPRGAAHTARILTDEVRLAFLSPASRSKVWQDQGLSPGRTG